VPLEPFTGLEVDYLLGLLDETEQAAIDQLVQSAGTSTGRTLDALLPPGVDAIAERLDEPGHHDHGRG
jgi:hypothetical protein